MRAEVVENPHLDPSRRATAAIVFATLGVAAVAFAPLFAGGFQADDFPHVVHVLERGPFAVWSGGESFFRPVVSLSFWLDAMLWGPHARGFHVSNVSFHIGTALAVGWLAMRLSRADGPAAPRVWLAGALLFTVLPSHSEAVGWISARVDLLSALGAVGSLVFYVRFREHGGRGHLAGSLVALAFGLLSKESVLLTPLILVVIEIVHFESSPRRAVVRVLPFFLLGAVYVLVRAVMVGDLVGGYGATRHLDLTPLARNLRTFPVRVWLPPLDGDAYVVCARVIFVVAGGAFGVALWRDRRRALRFGLASAVAFYAAAAPMLTLWVSRELSSGERFLYWPSAVACVVVVAAGSRFARHRVFPIVLLSVVVVAGAISYRGVVPWARAGQETEAVARAIAALPEQRRTLVGPLLDSRQGIYMFRNAFEYAMRLYSDTPRATIPLAPIRFREDDTRAPLVVALEDGGAVIEASAAEGGLFVLDRFTRGVQVRVREPKRVVVELPDANAADAVVIVEGVRLDVCRPTLDCPSGATR